MRIAPALALAVLLACIAISSSCIWVRFGILTIPLEAMARAMANGRLNSATKACTSIAGYEDCWNRTSPSLVDAARSRLQALIEAEGRSINASRKLDAERWGGSMVPVEDEAEGKIGWLKERMAWIDSQLAAQGAEAQP